MATEPSPDDMFWALLAVASRLRQSTQELMAAETWLADTGFRPPCMSVLHCVVAVGPISQRGISDHLLLDPSDLVGVLDILEHAGFVERRRDPADRRRHAVVATDAGREADERLAVVRTRVMGEVLAELDDDRRTELARLLIAAVDDGGRFAVQRSIRV
ncbi:MAG: MarR family winged helix-turn-helix transcriptional regulator [Actinomycetota bacterium]|nr:MarR family winged helix-turn-helix transcriptional regulator [Actinomycetota bacterium]